MENSKATNPKRISWITLFPVLVLAIYGILFIFMPDKALEALKSSGNVSLSLVLPLGLVFILMILFNLFIKPAQIARFLGRGAGIKGVLFSTIAGIISTGPIYAWYPLLKELRSKGAANSLVSIFLYNRAVKPFLLPLMIAYFSWKYVVILTVLTVLSSIVIGFSMESLMKEKGST